MFARSHFRYHIFVKPIHCLCSEAHNLSKVERKAGVILDEVLSIACFAHFSFPSVQPLQCSYEILAAVMEHFWNTISAGPSEMPVFLAKSCVVNKLTRNVLGSVRGMSCLSGPWA